MNASILFKSRLENRFSRDDLLEAEELPMGLVRIDPARNVSRGGRWLPPEHPRIQRYADEIRRRGLLEPVGLRLIEPVRRPCGGPCCPDGETTDEERHHLVEVVYGFARLSALLSLDRASLRLRQPGVEATIHADLSDEAASDACLAENVVRDDPSDYEVAVQLRNVALRPEYQRLDRVERYRSLAEQFAYPSAHRVENLVRIVERCPPDLLDAWDLDSSAEARRVLERVSRIDLGDALSVDERHERMRKEFASLRGEGGGSAPPSPDPASSGGLPRDGRGKRPVSRALSEKWLGRLETSREVYDEDEERYRPLGGGERRAIRSVLAFLLSGGQGPDPVR